MRRLVRLFFLGAAIMAAQPAAKDDVFRLANQLDAAIQARDWAQAVQISRALKRSAEDARNQSMATQQNELADSVLAWLPSDTPTDGNARLSNLLLTVMHKMEVDTERFVDSLGPVSEVLA